MTDIPDSLYFYKTDLPKLPKDWFHNRKKGDSDVEYRRVGECVWSPTGCDVGYYAHYETTCGRVQGLAPDEETEKDIICKCGNKIKVEQ